MPGAAAITRRSALGLGLGAAVAACSSKGGSTNATNPGKLTHVPAYKAPPKVEGAITSDVVGVPPGYATIPAKQFTTTDAPFHAKPVSSFSIVWGNPPNKLSNNVYWQLVNAALGTKYNGIFVPFDSYDAKVATTLASGDLPDVMELLPSATSDKAILQGAFADLTDVLGGDGIKKYPNLQAIRPELWQTSAVNGRLYGIPLGLPLFDMQWSYRADWATKLGYPDAPRNPDEFLTLMSAMSKGKPAGHKTYGIGSYGGSFGSSFTILINAMFKVPNEWRHNKDGSLTNAIDTDEYEQAIQYTRKLWQAGAFHPDAISLGDQGAKTLDMFTSNQIGLIKTGIAGAMNPPYVDMFNHGVRPLVPPGANGFAVPATNGLWGRSVIPAKIGKDKNRLHEILQFYNYLAAPVGSKELTTYMWGKENVTYDLKNNFPVIRTKGAIANDVVGFAGLCAPWFYQSPAGRPAIERGVSYCEKMVQSSVGNPVSTIISPTENRLSAQLTNLQQDYINPIVTGRRPMSDLDKYRKEWHRRGGDQIIGEYRRALDKTAGH
jgi:putative aldouronate transport system substrate-binding protein